MDQFLAHAMQQNYTTLTSLINKKQALHLKITKTPETMHSLFS